MVCIPIVFVTYLSHVDDRKGTEAIEASVGWWRRVAVGVHAVGWGSGAAGGRSAKLKNERDCNREEARGGRMGSGRVKILFDREQIGSKAFSMSFDSNRCVLNNKQKSRQIELWKFNFFACHPR